MSKDRKNNTDHSGNVPGDDGLNPTLVHEIGATSAGQDSISVTSRTKYSTRGEPRQGGMAIVWKAFDSQLQREVAYKELRPESTDDERFRKMFVNEAKLTGQLEHPNIIPVYDMGQSDAQARPYYTMKYLRGLTLTEAIRQHRSRQGNLGDARVKLAPLLRMLLRVCDAIRYAHSRGIIHRDLKPDNVMVGDFGEVIVLDWGLAKPIASSESDLPNIRFESGSYHETEAGIRKGTPAYWAPEQAQGKNDLVDHRTDVYGIGAILYEILTGHAPHARRTDTSGTTDSNSAKLPDTVTKEIGKSVPAALIAICNKAMSEKRSERYSSVAKLARDVDRWMIDEPVTAYEESLPQRALRWGRRHQVASLVSAVCMLAIVVIGGALYSVDQVRRKQVTDQEIQSLQEFATGQGTKLTSYITSLRQDVTFLSEMRSIQRLLQSSGDESSGAESSTDHPSANYQAAVDSVAETFSTYLGQKFDYMQVRVLDADGLEVVRVERKVPGAQPVVGPLSNKGDRPYFKESISLPKGTWYLSPIELNVENGQKQPELPVVRGAVPIFQEGSSEACGIVIINTHFREIVKSLDNFNAHQAQGVIYLTNRDGQFLYHPNHDLSFAFERELDYRIQHLYPELQPEFQREDVASSIRQSKRTGIISQATQAQPAIWIRTQLRPYQAFNSDEMFQTIRERFRGDFKNSAAQYPDIQCKIGDAGEAIVYGPSESELTQLSADLKSNFGYPVDVEMIPMQHRGESHAIQLNFLPLQLGDDQQSLGLVLVLPSDAFASHSGTGRNIFWLAVALLMGIAALTFLVTHRKPKPLASF